MEKTCPYTGEWIMKMWYTNTMEYYSAFKNQEILPFVPTHMKLHKY
jgi:hypothetical protein